MIYESCSGTSARATRQPEKSFESQSVVDAAYRQGKVAFAL